MSVLVGKDTKVIVQGMGNTGRFHTDTAIAYGTQMVGAVHPRFLPKRGVRMTYAGLCT